MSRKCGRGMYERSSHAVGDRARAVCRSHANGVMTAHAPRFQTAACDRASPPSTLSPSPAAGVVGGRRPARRRGVRGGRGDAHARDGRRPPATLARGRPLGPLARLRRGARRLRRPPRPAPPPPTASASIALTSSVVGTSSSSRSAIAAARPSRARGAAWPARSRCRARSSWPSGHSASASAFRRRAWVRLAGRGRPPQRLAPHPWRTRASIRACRYPSEHDRSEPCRRRAGPAAAVLRRWQKRRR